MSLYIRKLIEQGEHQQLDFKYEISDAKKIARTFAAFANTKGGALLIGVKDNGKITGIKTDEEVYMAESAAHIYCNPKVEYTIQNWKVDGRWVLEIKVPKSKSAPHKAPWKDGKLRAFIRIHDQNHLANRLIYKSLLLRNNQKQGALIKYQEEEQFLLRYLNEHDFITFSAFKKHLKISAYKAEKVMVNLLSLDVLSFEYTENGYRYKLS